MDWLEPPSPDHCPRCRYSLRGLPPEHRCPECGFPYGPGSVVWGLDPDDTGEQQAIRGRRLRYNVGTALRATFTGLVVLLCVGAAARGIGPAGARLSGIWILLAMAAAFLVLMRRSRRGQRAYLNADGIDVVVGRRWMHLDWTDVLEVVREDDATIIDVKPGRVPPISVHFVEHDDYLRFRDGIIRRRDAALAQGPPATRDTP